MALRERMRWTGVAAVEERGAELVGLAHDSRQTISI